MTAAPLGHEREGQGADLVQGIDDELLGVRGVWRVQDCSGRQRMDGRASAFSGPGAAPASRRKSFHECDFSAPAML